MDGLQAFKYYTAVKLHFTTEKFDVFVNKGKINCSRAAFERRNDRILFEKLADKFSTDRELIQFFVANFAYGNTGVVYSQDSDEYFTLWMKRKESISRVFETDLHKIVTHLELNKLSGADLFSIDDVPELLKLYLSNEITVETMCIIETLDPYLDDWQPYVMLWGDTFRLIQKLKRFVPFKQDKVELLYTNHKEIISELQHGADNTTILS
jgi:hypothetical protein